MTDTEGEEAAQSGGVSEPDTASLFGRERELRHLEQHIARVGGRGEGLLLSGEAGIGKSALLRWATETAIAGGMRVLSTTGTPSETGLAFAGLHQLLLPLRADVDALPERQRSALLAAFRTTDDPAPELFLVALAVLNVLSEASARKPVMVVVDDAHWLDPASTDVLAFVARRLEAEPILVMVAIRDGMESVLDEVGLLELRVQPLDPAAASALLQARAPDLAPEMHERLLEEAAGNPLALVELPIGMIGLDEGSTPTPWLPLTSRLERAFASRASDLSNVTRTLLLVAAVNDGAAVSETLLAARTLLDETPGARDLAPAVADRLIELEDTGLRFRHPLIRSAIRQGATVAERQAAHAALAGVLGSDPDRRAWHRAAASTGPDEGAASELEATAARAWRRGDVAAAVAALERAAGLSVDSAARGRRLLNAADHAYEQGQAPTVIRLLDEAERFRLTPQEQVRVASYRAFYDAGPRTSAAAVRTLAENAERAGASGDTELALQLLRCAAARSWWTDTPWIGARERLVAALEDLSLDESEPSAMYILALGAPVERGAVVVDRLRRVSPDVLGDPAAAHFLGWAASEAGVLDTAVTLLGEASAGLRAQGRLGLLPQTLVSLAWTAFLRGDLRTAGAAADEATRLAQEAGDPYVIAQAKTSQALVDAVRGNLDGAEAVTAELEQDALPAGASLLLARMQLVRGLAALGAGRPSDALQQLRRIYEPGDPAHHPWVGALAVPELAEAAVHAQQQETVRSLIERYEGLAIQTRSPALRAGLSYARPLFAADPDAEGRFAAAVGEELADWPLLRARTQLAFGQWLRRRRRISESRAPLRSAIETFDALGASWWSERAHREILASGETSRRHVVHDRDQLTPQELQIAQMAAEGFSNREIAESLYISRRTVSTHLYRVFPKLNISSRSELAAALDIDLPAARRRSSAA